MNEHRKADMGERLQVAQRQKQAGRVLFDPQNSSVLEPI
jgi:hypothetical protein